MVPRNATHKRTPSVVFVVNLALLLNGQTNETCRHTSLERTAILWVLIVSCPFPIVLFLDHAHPRLLALLLLSILRIPVLSPAFIATFTRLVTIPTPPVGTCSWSVPAGWLAGRPASKSSRAPRLRLLPKCLFAAAAAAHPTLQSSICHLVAPQSYMDWLVQIDFLRRFSRQARQVGKGILFFITVSLSLCLFGVRMCLAWYYWNGIMNANANAGAASQPANLAQPSPAQPNLPTRL
ncbi:hypothetical protein B0T17DRAFT_520993 [Bombardia bombarda]|uniref:Uncharacterized protein n=1 Tax=Bombardia bombarda TaxID=252184 RepID=A0AA39XP67_9PEZI|nr:hypothetical protein B0T17DRAFT_520993 [Bombardia bombarda]